MTAALRPVTFSHTFPSGDATAKSGTAWDIVGVATTIETQPGVTGLTQYNYLRVDVTFAQNVQNALPVPGTALSSGSQLGVLIGIDSDANINTGTYGTCNFISALKPFEYATDQGNDPSRLVDGNYGIAGPDGGLIYSGSPNAVDEANVTVSGNTFSEGFYLPTIAVAPSSSAPKIGVTAEAFNGFGETDCVPLGASSPELLSDVNYRMNPALL